MAIRVDPIKSGGSNNESQTLLVHRSLLAGLLRLVMAAVMLIAYGVAVPARAETAAQTPTNKVTHWNRIAVTTLVAFPPAAGGAAPLERSAAAAAPHVQMAPVSAPSAQRSAAIERSWAARRAPAWLCTGAQSDQTRVGQSEVQRACQSVLRHDWRGFRHRQDDLDRRHTRLRL
jgi:hypothetical protein